MREGWEYKNYQWNEVLTIINGKNQSAVVSAEGKYPIYGSGGIMGFANEYLCPENCVIIGRKGNINKPIYVTDKFWNVDTAFGLYADSTLLLPKYLYYFCLEYNFEKHNKTVTIPSLTKVDLLKINISLPSVEHQRLIASELDMITEMISKYDEQLKELDKLSQSIFYEMFGDPVENEKGWEVKIISDVSTYFNGVAHEQDIDDDGEYTLINSKFISTNGKVQKRTNKQRFPLLKNDLTMVLSDVPNGKALAKCYLVNEDNKYSLNQRICCFRGYEGAPLFFKYVVNRHQYFLSFNDGKGQTNLRKGDVEKMPIILPPLPLQQSFARKIEAIEAMKSKVREAKKEAETLLAARMQYWFE